MNNETNTTEEKITIISSQISDELSVIGECLKIKMGVNLTNGQVIQHLIHMFKMMNPQGLSQQPFPGSNPYPLMHPPMFPPGARWAIPSQDAGLDFQEVFKNNNKK